MANLADTSDLAARLGRALTATETTRAAAYLADASGLVRRYTGQDFTTVSSDAVILRPVGSYLVLPQTPVTSVDSVSGVGDDGVPGDPVTGWVFDGIDRIDITTVGLFGSTDPWWPWPHGPESFQVVYGHGLSDAPDDVVAVVCGMVNRVLLSPSQVEGMSSEHIGQYSYQLSQQIGGGAPGVAVRLSEQDKDDLKHYRQHATSIQARV